MTITASTLSALRSRSFGVGAVLAIWVGCIVGIWAIVGDTFNGPEYRQVVGGHPVGA